MRAGVYKDLERKKASEERKQKNLEMLNKQIELDKELRREHNQK